MSANARGSQDLRTLYRTSQPCALKCRSTWTFTMSLESVTPFGLRRLDRSLSQHAVLQPWKLIASKPVVLHSSPRSLQPLFLSTAAFAPADRMRSLPWLSNLFWSRTSETAFRHLRNRTVSAAWPSAVHFGPLFPRFCCQFRVRTCDAASTAATTFSRKSLRTHWILPICVSPRPNAMPSVSKLASLTLPSTISTTPLNC